MRKTNAMLTALICVATMVCAESAVALNPQPLPPGRHSTTTLTGKNTQERATPGGHTISTRPNLHNGTNPGVDKLNPQPLPPG
ncbi:MAG: hypothetical protein ACLQUZ_19565 [Rhizomicrobium sp.]